MMMKAIRIHAYGGPDVMQLEELPMPVPGPEQALVRVHAASVNFLDIQKRRGELVGQAFYQRAGGGEPEFPATLGSQGVGIVEALGPEVSNVRVGDRVSFWGISYATHTVIPTVRLIVIPDGISFEQAAAGVIGLLLCQMAKIRGGRVIGVTSSERKSKFVREAGAEEVIISKQSDIAKEARRITEGRGVSVVFDGVGKDTFEANLNSVAPAGYLVIYGQSSGYVPPIDLMTLQEKGSLFLTRTNGLPYVKEYPNYIRQFVTWIEQGKLSIRIDRTYPLAEAAQAHAAFERRQISGRVLLLP